MVGAVTWMIGFKTEREGVGPSKNWVEQIFLLERRDKPKMGGGWCYFFYYFTVQFSHIYFVCVCVGWGGGGGGGVRYL